MKFQDALLQDHWFWGSAYSLAYACKLSYKSGSLVETVVTGTWEFDRCRLFDRGDNQGFIGWTDQLVVLTFRGTDGLRDFFYDFNFAPRDLDRFHVHRGFWDCFEAARDDVAEGLREAEAGGKRLFITGHSLGGALATLAAAEFHREYDITGVYTYGKPATGLRNFADYLNSELDGRCFRFANRGDVITRVPPGFHHARTPVYLDENGAATVGVRSGAEEDGTMIPEAYAEKRGEVEMTLKQLASYAEMERSGGDGPRLDPNRLPGIREHSIDRYIERIGRELSDSTRRQIRGAGEVDDLFVFPADLGGAVDCRPDREAPEEPCEEEPMATDPESFSASPRSLQGDLPFSVHVVWSPKCREQFHPCERFAEEVFRFLGHVPGHEYDLEAGVGIPVFVGYHFAEVRRLMARAAVDPGISLVVIPLLQVDAVLDDGFTEFLHELLALHHRGDGPAGVRVAPVWLDMAWYEEVRQWGFAERHPIRVREGEGIESALWQIGVGISRLLREGDGSGDVDLYISRARADREQTGALARRLLAAFPAESGETAGPESIFSAHDLAETGERGEGAARNPGIRRLREEKDGLFLVLRSDAYAECPDCQRDLLDAKRFGIPIVTLNILTDRERRSLAYGGNSVTLAGGGGEEEAVALCRQICLQAWLAHLHFHRAAPLIFHRHALEVEPSFLSRPPELLDFAQGPLNGSETAIVLYPDPPMPVVETNLIRRGYPRVRLATPTTLSEETMRRSPSPPLEGLLVGLSLSDSVSDLAGSIREFDESFAGCVSGGVFKAHLTATVAYLTLTLVRGGAQLGFGGALREKGFARLLESLIKPHRQSRSTEQQKLLHSFLAAFLWEKNPPDSSDFDARFYRIPEQPEPAAETPVERAWELSRMRMRMAEACDARIVLGGKVRRETSPGEALGYAGRFPGQAEEAMRHLLQGKPIYVAGGFFGATGMVAKALCHRLDELPRDADFADIEGYEEFCRDYEARLDPDDPMPRTLGALWEKFAEFGNGFFWGATLGGGMKWVDNGLTPAENRRLFESVHDEEISALVMKGLQQLAARRSDEGSAPLKLALFNGSITDALNVEAYGVLVLESAKLRGADGALDTLLDGAIQRWLEAEAPEHIIRVKANRLMGDYVIVHLLGSLQAMLGDASGPGDWLKRQIVEGIGRMAKKVKKHKIRSLALVPSGVNLGITAEQSVETILEAILATRDESRLESLAICEMDSGRYEEVLRVAQRFEESGRVTLTELPPQVPPEIRSPLFVSLTCGEGADSGGLELKQFVRGPSGRGAVEIRPVSFSADRLSALVDPHRELPWPEQDSPPFFAEHERRGEELGRMIFSDSVRAEILRNRGRAWDVLHDVPSSAIPLELLAFRESEEAPYFWPALENGIRRGLLVDDLPTFEPYVFKLPLRLLLIANPTGDLKNTEEEAAIIQEHLKSWNEIEVTSLIGPDRATLAEVRERFAQRGVADQIDLIHYAGHGDFDPEDPERSGLRFRDGILTGREIDEFDLEQPPMLVMINACKAGRVEDTLAGASLAHRVLRTGVRGFISNRWTVGDASAARFAVTVYSQLARGQSLGQECLEARRALFRRKERDWANFVFYGAPDIRL